MEGSVDLWATAWESQTKIEEWKQRLEIAMDVDEIRTEIHEPNKPVQTNVKANFLCAECDRWFLKKANLTRHMSAHKRKADRKVPVFNTKSSKVDAKTELDKIFGEISDSSGDEDRNQTSAVKKQRSFTARERGELLKIEQKPQKGRTSVEFSL